MSKRAAPSPLRKQFGRQLRQIRRVLDITQAQLAERIHTSVEHISNLERGVAAPSFETLEALAEALGVKVKDFFDFKE
ncbi:MAG TPA: helix-turn-helix transcriptional regulator [Acidobacteriota bacterium]|nr:helix-turn-helix transcriptional regulator [Acidobacteriota bacterium]HMZ78824.1 helix-turn-helix transcriptional regulator [Acidobacteriota bacterium]HNB73445.1 helix-turn-helix transcriptional regulator [Acidobacteriota bacterium]HNG95300.1 helix-turn-helix transcriptional regulator [Acidobacteriota bacterium]